jgi:lycopene cyclase domain-containing protein
MEYTLLTMVGFFLVLGLDYFLQTKIIRLSLKLVYTTIIFVVFQLIFDNLFTREGLWVFNKSETLGIFVPFIPIENLFFGIEMLWFTLILFSFFSREKRK